MTYFGFLLRFLVIPILVFLAITWSDNKKDKPIRGFQNRRAVWIGIAIHIFLAVAYTTLWDNYLVATGVWYYNPKLVTGIVLGYVPIEEYTFFVLETILAGLWWWFLARKLPESRNFKPSKPIRSIAFSVLLLAWILFTSIFFSRDQPLTYLSITLFWALPAIFPQMLFGADILWRYRKLLTLAIIIPSAYLSLMDIVALRAGTWSISPAQTTGVLFFGILPIEEVVFFFVTNILIAFGMTLLLSNESKQRLSNWKSKKPQRTPMDERQT